MSKRIVRRIPNLPSPQLSFKAVGIYARVSTQRPSQFSSISSQISALVHQVYHTYVQHNPNHLPDADLAILMGWKM